MTEAVFALRERHIERSRVATAPEDLPLALSRRLPKKSGLTVVHHGRAAISAYHRRRRAGRGHEAVSPGEMGRLARLRYAQFVKKRRTVWNPKSRDYEQVEYSYQADFRQCVVVPKYVAFSTSFDAADKAILTALYGLASFDDLTRDGKFVVRNVTTADLAAYAGVSVSTFYRHVRRLAAAGAVVVQRIGLNKANVYYLASTENGSWMYPQGSNQSARARVQAQLHRKDINDIDWKAYCQAPTTAPDRKPLPRHFETRPVPQNRPKLSPEPKPLGNALVAFFDAVGSAASAKQPSLPPAPDRSNQGQPIYVKATSNSVTRSNELPTDDRPPGRST